MWRRRYRMKSPSYSFLLTETRKYILRSYLKGQNNNKIKRKRAKQKQQHFAFFQKIIIQLWAYYDYIHFRLIVFFMRIPNKFRTKRKPCMRILIPTERDWCSVLSLEMYLFINYNCYRLMSEALKLDSPKKKETKILNAQIILLSFFCSFVSCSTFLCVFHSFSFSPAPFIGWDYFRCLFYH